jgi:hypothetical protein
MHTHSVVTLRTVLENPYKYYDVRLIAAVLPDSWAVLGQLFGKLADVLLQGSL